MSRRPLLLETLEDRILCSAAPQVSISAPANPKIGEKIPVTVSFTNVSGTNPGFGPYVDLVLDHSTGVTGTGGGVDFVVGSNSATFLGAPVATTKLTFQAADAGHPTGPYAIHPYANDAAGNPLTVYAPTGYGVGDTLLVLQLPFGSFTPTQPTASVTLDLTVSNLAELGNGLNISARGGFQFGNDALDNPSSDPSIVGAYQSTTVTPQLLTLTKTYLGPEDETATGPNYVRQYRLDVDIAPGQTVTNLQLSDLLPENMQFLTGGANNVQVLVQGVATGAFTSTSTPSTTIPGGTLTRTLTTSVTGDATTAADATLIFSYYIPRIDAPVPAPANVIVPANTGAQNTATDTANAQGNWNPIDPGDPQNVLATAAPATHTLNVKSIATQKSVAIVTDTGAAGATPGDTLEYTIQVQVSDYFAFQNLLLSDTFSDGQRLDASFAPTFTWTEHGVTYTTQNFNAANYVVTPRFSAGDGSTADGTDGTTDLVFDLSGEMVSRGQDAKLLGGGIPDAGTGVNPLPNQPPLPFNTATTVTVRFRTIIQDAFTDNIPSGNAQLNPRDVLTNAVTVSGAVLNVTNVTTPTGFTASDTSAASVAIVNSTVSKTIYAINGLLTTDPTFAARYIGSSGQYLVSPNDTVTYRLTYYLPTGDVENLALTDFLPLPVFSSTEITTFDDVISAAAPIAGHAKYGPTETLRALHGSTPTITTDAAGNSVLFNYGTTNNAANSPRSVDFLFTVTVGAQPFADGLFLTNQVRAAENNTQEPATTVTSDAIIQFQIQEPIVTIAKGVVGYNSTGLTLGGIAFTDPTLASSFTGTVSNATQATAIGASDALIAAGLDGGDRVRYAVILQNSGRNDAYDLRLSDAVPAGYVIPGSAAAMGLTVRHGDGTLLTLGTDYTATISGAGVLSIELTDNYTAGNLGGETRTGALSRGFNANNATAVTNGSNTVVITYDLTLEASVPQAGSTITNTVSLSNYAGSEGGNNFTPTPLTDPASVTLRRPTLTKVLTGTEINATGNNAATQAVIGELATYTLTLTVPEGQTPGAVLNDVLDAGLAFVDVQTVTLSAGLSATTSIGTGTNPANVTITNSGRNLAFNFGTLTNSNTVNATAETITIVYRAVVLNTNTAPSAPGNQTGSALNNAASFSAQYTDVPTGSPTAYSFNQTTATTNVAVVEPALTLTKTASTTSGGTYVAALTNVDGGDTIFYRVRIVNAANAPTAFNTTLSDALPAFLTTPTIFSVTGGGFTAADFTISGSTLQTVSASGLDIAGGTTLDIIVQGTISSTIAATQAFTNTANVAWSSLSGAPGVRSVHNAASTERTGAGGVGTDTAVLNNYAAASTATVTDSSITIDKRFQGGSLSADDTNIATVGANALDRVVVGESVLYDMLVTLPEGVSQNLRVDDLIPAGMRLDLTFNGGLGYQIITTAAASSGQLAADFSDAGTLAVPTLAAVNGGTLGQDGTDGRLTFGNVTVTADNVATNNAFLIRVRAIVTDVIGNQAATTLNNAAQVVFTNPNTGGTTTVADATPNDHIVTVIEPTLTIAKTVSTPSGDAGDPISYTIVLQNPAGANLADAYNVQLSDNLPAEISAPAISLLPADFSATGFGSFTAPTVNDFEIVNLAGTNVLRLKTTVTLDMPVGSSVSLKVGGALVNTVVSGQTINNTVITNWTSTPGVNADERTGAGIPNPTLSTPDAAVLNNYSIASSAVTTAVIGPVVSKTIFTTSEATTSSNFTTGLHNVAPGEIVTYRVTVALPEGSTPSFRIIDNIPSGLAYVPGSVVLFAARPDGTVVALNAAQPGTGTATFNGSGLAAPTVTSSPTAGNPFVEGTDIQFDFGSLTTAGDNNTNNNSFHFTYQAVVLDVAGNTGLQGTQVTRTNSVAYSVNGGASTTGLTDPAGTTATLIEPRLGVNKTVLIGAGTTGDAGDTLNYSAIISHQANSLADAFETTFADTLPAQITTPGAFTVTHSTLGDISARFEIAGGILRTIAGQSFDLALGQTVTVAFTSTLTSAVTPNQTIDSTAAIAYTGLTGDKTSPTFNPTADVATDRERTYAASDTGPVTVPVATLTKTLFATSDANTSGANLGIGETATYALRVTLPEGTTPNLSVVDLLPAGLQYLSSSLVTTAAASGGLLTADFAGTVPAPTTTGGAANGDDVTFTFGSISTTGDNAAGNNSFLIFITARALDVGGNVGTTPGQTSLPNAATLDITGDGVALFTTPNVPATVVEPRLQITKSASDTTPDPGQTLTYTLTIAHTASSTAIAYDVLLRDAIPANITLNTGSILVNGVAVGSSALVDSNASTSSLLDLKFTQLATGGTITISYTATVTTNPAVAGANLDNNAKIYWDTDAAEDPNTVLSGGSDGTPDRDLGAVAGVEVFNANTDPAQDTERVVVNSSTISGVVYHDANANGSFGGADTGIVGVTVVLSGTDLNSNVISRTTTTSAGGAYSFTGLTAGVYTITETQPATFTDALETVGTNFGGTKSDALSSDTITGVTIPVQTSATGAGYNFGETRTSSLAGSVYSDVNNDGIRQGGESGIAGTPVRLTGTDVFGQSVLLNGTTDASGNYFFDNAGVGLRPGTYVVLEVTQPAAFLDGRETAGTSGGNATAVNEQISGIVLAQNTAATGYVFGELNPVTLSGFVYHDANNDGVKQGAESPISGATVTLTGFDDLGAAVSLSTTTDASGAYAFAILRPSNATGYTITETQPAGFLDGRDTLGTGLSAPNGAGTVGPDRFTNVSIVNVATGNNAGANYNFGEVLAGSVAGRVFSDLNNDGLQNGADAAIAGVTVALSGLDDLGNAVNLTTTTNATGDYSFTGLRPSGAAGYTLTETQPAAYLDGKDTSGSTGGTIGAPPSDTITTIPLVSGANSTGNNFAELNPASLSGFVYADTNNDGVKQGAESGIAGATVTLTGTNDLGQAVSLTATTSGTGAYSFTNLRPGTYVLTETQPAAFLDGKDTLGTGLTAPNNAGTLGADTFTGIVIADLTAGNNAGANYNFGELTANSLAGRVFSDANNDGLQNGTDTGIAGVTLTLTGTDDLGVTVNRTTTTNGTGDYLFANVRPGDYILTETQPAAFLDGKNTVGTQGGATVNLPLSDTITAISLPTAGIVGTGNNFAELAPASLSGFVYADTNNDGVKQGAESGISGAMVTLTGFDDLGSAVNLTTTTSGTGAYSFANLRPSSAAGYTITETQPPVFLDGRDTIGTPGGTAANDVFSGVVLTAGTAGAANDFGELAPSSLAGRVFNDGHNDGLENGTDTAIAGVTLTLTGTDDLLQPVSLTTTTNGTGDYSFTNLRPGTYVLTETQPAGLLDGRNAVGSQGGTTTNNPLSDTITAINLATAGINGTANNFAELNPASLAGNVYQDLNNNGVREAGESGIQAVTITLTGTDDLGNAVSTATSTNSAGAYSFTNLRPGTYRIAETQPTAYTTGINAIGTGLSAPNAAGTVSGDDLQAITFASVAAGNNAGVEYNFGEIFAPQLGKTVAGTSQAHTAGNTVAVGETVRYRITAEIPQSTFTDLVITDLLPSGLVYVNDGTASYAFVATNAAAINSTFSPNAPAVSTSGAAFVTGNEATVSTVTPAALLGATSISSDLANTTQAYASGGSIYFHLGTVSNFDGDANREFVVIEFNALVRNETANQAATTLGNGVRLTFDTNNSGGTTGTDTPASTLTPAAGPQITIAEPNLTISKTTPALPNPVDAGDTITYTITVTNNAAAVFGAANAADAFDVRVQDILDAIRAGNPTVELTLANPASDVSISAPGYATATNNSTASTVDLAISRLNVGDSATITVTALVKADAPAGATITNTATASYTSLPGTDANERTGADVPAPTDNTPPANSAVLNNYGVGASAGNKTVATPTITKTLVSTSETATTGSNVAIGETVTYALNLTLPEGVAQSVSILDALPAGLQFLSATTDFAGSGVTAFVLPAPTFTGNATTGTNLTWTLGNVTNPPDGNAANNTFRILVTARVADLAGNSAGTTRTNAASLTYTDGTNGPTTVTSNPATDPTVTVVEPRLTLAKGVDDTTPDINQTLHYTLTITNPAVANAADGFDIFVRDFIPTGLTLDTASIAINGVNIATSPLVQGGAANSTANLLDVQLTTLAVGGTITITYDALVNNTIANVSTTQDNNARIYWDSLVANDGNNSVLTGTPNPSDERDSGATPAYTETPTPGVDDPAQDTVRVVVNANAITGAVYNDNDSSGSFNGGDTAISGVTLRLTGTTASGLAVDVTTTSAANGSYSFGNLPPGTYLITETQPAGYIDAIETAGTGATTFGGVKSDLLGSNTISAILIPAQSNTTETRYDFGETLPSSLAGSVYLDTDNSGLRNVGETGLANVPVTLTGTDAFGQSVTLSANTDADGRYLFTGLRPGSYTVTEDDSALVPASYLDGKDTPGSSGGVRGGASPKFDALTSIVLPQGTAATDYNFAELVPASLAGAVYVDANGNSTRDGAETGIANATVTLTGLDDLGNAVSTNTLTSGTGAFTFTGLRPGTYTLTETQPAGFADGGDALGTLGGTLGNDVLSNIGVTPGVNGTAYLFGERTTGISGTVFIDRNANSTLDSTEPGRLGGVLVTLLDGGGATVGTTTTAADGTYSFSNLTAGDYTVIETQPTGYGSSTANTLNVTVPTAGLTGINFGETTGSLAGTVYADADQSGTLNAGDTGLSGVTVTLTGTDANGAGVTRTASTAADGTYLFTDLLSGSYSVSETQPANYTSAMNSAGTAGGTVAADTIGAITLGAAQSATNYTFGEILNVPPQRGAISGTVFIDLDEAGTFDTGENGIAGVTLTLRDSLGNSVATTTTGAGGSYSFSNLLPGSYTIEETQPLAYGSSTANTLTPVAVVADAITANQNFGETYGSLAGFVYVDANNDAVKGGAETPLAGVTVTLTGTDVNGASVNRTAVTQADGSYVFDQLLTGIYTLTESQPATYADGLDTLGTSGGTLGNDVLSNIGLGGGIDATAYNFGERPTALSGTVFVDADKDGALDGGESGLGGVLLTLRDAGNNIVGTTTTAADGSFSFGGLAAGNYTVLQTQPNAYGSSTANTFAVTVPVTGLTGVNFGETTASLAGRVYVDADASGSLTAGDADLGGVTVALSGSDFNGAPVNLTTTTGADGSYAFTGLLAGNYTVTETQPAGFNQGSDNVGSAGGQNLVANSFTTIGLAGGVDATGYNFGEVAATPAGSGIIAGTVFLDANKNATLDGSETGLDGSLLFLLDALGNVLDSTFTNPDGTYVFSNVAPGTGYQVQQVIEPQGYGSSTPGTLTGITVVADSVAANNNFGETAGSLAGTVFRDTNNNGAQDPGETGLAGVTVTLSGSDVNGAIVPVAATTDANGRYTFTGLLTGGSYTISETQPAAYGDGLDTAGNAAVAGSVANDVVSGIEISAAQDATGYNFGELGATLRGTVFVDQNTNGTLQLGETGIGSVAIQLLDSNGVVVATTTSAPDGTYAFTGLAAGNYTVLETQPAAYGSNSPNTVATSVPAGGTSTVDFAEITGSIAGIVYHDRNHNGLIDANEPLIGGATITLTGQDVNGNATAPQTTLTLADGSYTFTGLAAGTYTLTETQPAGYYDGRETVGSTGGNPTVNDVISGIGLGAAQSETGYLFGERIPSDLVTTKTDDLTTVVPGQVLTYTITVSNASLQQAEGVIVTDQFPKNVLQFLSASNGGVYDAAAGTITWNLGQMPTTDLAHPEITLTIEARVIAPVPALAENVRNTVTVRDTGSPGPDPTPENNTAEDTDTLRAAPDLFVVKTQNLTSVIVGQTITYTLTGGNAGDQTASGVIISDALPPGLRFVSASLGGRLVGGQVVWEIAALAPGETFSFTVTAVVVSVPSGGLAVNTAVITDETGSFEDPTPLNNTSTVRAGVAPGFLFAFDSFRNFFSDADDEPLPGLSSPHAMRDALLPLAPIYSGEADPGATLVVTLYNARGENIGSQTVTADAGGNWLTTFPSTIVKDVPNSVTITQLSAPYSLGDTHGHSLRTYFSSALNPGHFFLSTSGTGLGSASAPLLHGLGLENPLQLGSVKYGGELLSTQSTASGY